jgi:hypothetical protein
MVGVDTPMLARLARCPYNYKMTNVSGHRIFFE